MRQKDVFSILKNIIEQNVFTDYMLLFFCGTAETFGSAGESAEVHKKDGVRYNEREVSSNTDRKLEIL